MAFVLKNNSTGKADQKMMHKFYRVLLKCFLRKEKKQILYLAAVLLLNFSSRIAGHFRVLL